MGVSGFFKKIFGKKEDSLPPLEFGYHCINCTSLIPKDKKICANCGHNQNIPIIKKQTDIQTMADGVFLQFYDENCYEIMEKVFNEFIDEFCKRDIDEIKYNKIYNELIIFQLTIKYNIIIDHYNNHPKINKIDEIITKRIFDILNSLYGEKHFDYMKNLFVQRGREYWGALSDDNPIKSVSTMLRFIVEAIIKDYGMPDELMSLSTAKQWAMPLFYQSMQFGIFVANIAIPHKIILNKWEIIE